MPLVVDPSFAAAWFLPDEANDVAEAAERGLALDPARVPHLFRYELRNLIYVAFLRNRIDAPTMRLQVDRVGHYPFVYSDDPSPDAILSLATQHKLTTYDATYLALAKAEGLPLATNDKDIVKAARSERVAIITALPVPP